MQNHSFPFKLGTLAMTVLLATTLTASAQDTTTDPTACDPCEVEIVNIDDLPLDYSESIEVVEFDEEGVVEPDLIYYASGPDISVDAPSDEGLELILTSIGESGSVDIVVDDGIVERDDVDGIDFAVDDPTFLAATPAVAASGVIEVTATPTVLPVAAAQNVAVKRDRSNRTKRVAKGNACLQRSTYVAFICAWQGYEVPAN